MITVEEARAAILAEIVPLGAERVALTDALGRVLAETVVAPFDTPHSDNTAMDGYAVIAADVAHASDDAPARLRVIADLPAGYTAGVRVEPGSAIRIMTGAPMPEGADSVVIVEHTRTEGADVLVFRPVRPGANVRRRGEDVREGDVVLAPGAIVRPGEIGLLASLKRSMVRVYRKPTVAIASTGDELVEVDEPLAPGKLVNSNSYALSALVRDAGGIPMVLPIARDSLEEISSVLASAAAGADLVVTSGGVSVGQYDFVKAALDALGAEQRFWKVAMKPGKPLVFSRLLGKPFLGLPGNPVSSQVGFHLFVAPALRRAMGVPDDRLMRPVVDATLANDVRSTGDRRTFLRSRVEWRDGGFVAATRAAQGSGVASSMRDANGLVIVAEGVTSIAAGERAPVQLIGDLL